MNPKLSIMALFVVCFSGVVGSMSQAADYPINDGETHVVEDQTHVADTIYLRDEGCTGVGTCADPGAPTRLEVRQGGGVGSVWVYDTSYFTLNGGSVNGLLYAVDAGNVEISGGNVVSNMYANDISYFWIEGGNVTGALYAYQSGLIEIAGSGFAVDDVAVELGELEKLTGTLTGNLSSGGTINAAFYHAGALDASQNPMNGTIALVPEPGLHALQAAALILLLFLSRGMSIART